MVDELLHPLLHLDARGRRDLVVVDHHRAGVLAQPVDALLDDAVRLAEFLDAHEVAVVAVAVLAHRDVELHAVVDGVGLLLAQIPFDARAAQHRPGEAERKRALRRDDADADGALLPDAVLGEQRLVVVDVLRKALGEVLEKIEQRTLAVLVHLLDAKVTWDADFMQTIRHLTSGNTAIAGREFMEARFVDESTVGEGLCRCRPFLFVPPAVRSQAILGRTSGRRLQHQGM